MGSTRSGRSDLSLLHRSLFAEAIGTWLASGAIHSMDRRSRSGNEASDCTVKKDKGSPCLSQTTPPPECDEGHATYEGAESESSSVISSELIPVNHTWNNIQNEIRRRVILTDAHPGWTVGNSEDLSECTLRYVGGADVSYDGLRAVAALAVIDFRSMEVVEVRTKRAAVDVSYVPGYLGFREAPLILDLLQEIKVQRPGVYPQLLVVDGNGVFHPRRCGLACHVGVLVDIPAFGVAKKCLMVDRYNRHVTRELAEKYLHTKDSFLYLRNRENTELLGALYRPSAGSKKPVIVSVGHRVSLDTCVALMPRLCKSRICQPIRHADRLSRAALEGPSD